MKMDVKKLGLRLKQSREAADMSLNDVAKKVGLNKSTILRYENGEMATIKFPMLNALAEALNVHPNYLAGFIDNPQPEERGNNEPTIDGEVMSSNEQDLIRYYRKMDLRGQATIVNTIMEELKRIQKEEIK